MARTNGGMGMTDKDAIKELMKWSKGDLARRLLLAYRTISNLEAKIEAGKDE